MTSMLKVIALKNLQIVQNQSHVLNLNTSHLLCLLPRWMKTKTKGLEILTEWPSTRNSKIIWTTKRNSNYLLRKDNKLLWNNAKSLNKGYHHNNCQISNSNMSNFYKTLKIWEKNSIKMVKKWLKHINK